MPTGFRYAKHSDEPLKRKTLGVRPSCFPGLISMAYIHPSGTRPASPRWQKQNSPAEPYSLKVFPVGARDRWCGGMAAVLSAVTVCVSLSGQSCFNAKEGFIPRNLLRRVSLTGIKIPGNTVFLRLSISLSEGDVIVSLGKSAGYAQTLLPIKHISFRYKVEPAPYRKHLV